MQLEYQLNKVMTFIRTINPLQHIEETVHGMAMIGVTIGYWLTMETINLLTDMETFGSIMKHIKIGLEVTQLAEISGITTALDIYITQSIIMMLQTVIMKIIISLQMELKNMSAAMETSFSLITLEINSFTRTFMILAIIICSTIYTPIVLLETGHL
jgi:hypothetical protein